MKSWHAPLILLRQHLYTDAHEIAMRLQTLLRRSDLQTMNRSSCCPERELVNPTGGDSALEAQAQ
jgi:hypothetical protein